MITRVIGEILIGDSFAIRNVRSLIARIGPTRLPVLIQGPTGAGKELVARALHVASGRRGPLVAFNVTAIAESLFESAMFGHVKGAFSGAIADAQGYLAEANGGTCFMDEIGALPLNMQAKLLRALDDGVFRPVGDRIDRQSDYRLVVATNESIMGAMRVGRFRADLAYRLQGFVINVPSLEARRDDIPQLAETFLARCASSSGERARFSRSALALLRSREWPGNVRELKHAVDRASVLATTSLIDASLLKTLLDSDYGGLPVETLRREERDRLRAVLGEVGWDVARAAELLAVHWVTVYRRMKRLGIVRPPDRRYPSTAARRGT